MKKLTALLLAGSMVFTMAGCGSSSTPSSTATDEKEPVSSAADTTATVADTAEYHKVLIDGYAAIKDYPISFDAIDFTEEESKEWIENYPVYGLYIDGQLVSSITFCMPWVKYSTPDKYPHIAHFVTAPAFKGKGYAREVLGYAEELLKEQFKTHIVTLGTAKEHPWLPKMYESFGFTAYDKVHFRGKQHTTILFKKELN